MNSHSNKTQTKTVQMRQNVKQFFICFSVYVWLTVHITFSLTPLSLNFIIGFFFFYTRRKFHWIGICTTFTPSFPHFVDGVNVVILIKIVEQVSLKRHVQSFGYKGQSRICRSNYSSTFSLFLKLPHLFLIAASIFKHSFCWTRIQFGKAGLKYWVWPGY